MGWHAPPERLELDNPLWMMALELWAYPAFEEACLRAQDGGVCVSHILVALCSTQHGYYWNGKEPEPIRNWRTGVTEPLRAMRQNLPRDGTGTSALRTRLKQSELEAERLELAWWWNVLAGSKDGFSVDRMPSQGLAMSNLQNAGISEPQALAELWLSLSPQN